MMALLAVPRSNSVPITTKRHTWPEHPVVKDLSRKRALNDLMEVGPTLSIWVLNPSKVKNAINRRVYRSYLG